jgi:choline dehydrogenase-like flavoprotein
LPELMRQTWRYKLNKRAYVPSNARVHLRVHCEQEPLGESRISLSEKRDELGLFRATLNWRVSDLELDTMGRFTEIVRKAFGDLDLAIVEPDRDLLEDAASFRPKCDDSNHHMGGVRMSTSAIDGLVDPMLRLHGTRNAYVCSSAVFPTSGFSNPTHTLLALAIRLADNLAAKVSRPRQMSEPCTIA